MEFQVYAMPHTNKFHQKTAGFPVAKYGGKLADGIRQKQPGCPFACGGATRSAQRARIALFSSKSKKMDESEKFRICIANLEKYVSRLGLSDPSSYVIIHGSGMDDFSKGVLISESKGIFVKSGKQSLIVYSRQYSVACTGAAQAREKIAWYLAGLKNPLTKESGEALESATEKELRAGVELVTQDLVMLARLEGCLSIYFARGFISASEIYS